MKAPRNKSGSLKSNARSLLEGLPRLADLQMEDACHERRLLLLGFNSLLRDLSKRAGGNGIISPEERRRRIIEIYQRCYVQETDRRKQLFVLADFVGCFPHLALQADWFQKTVTSVSLTPDFSVGGTRRDTLLAVAKGFKRAANPTPRLRKQMRNHALETAREFRLGTAEQLKIWWSSLNAKDAAQEWLDERATAKLNQLAAEYPALKRYRKKLQELLRNGQHYKASIMIATSVFRVRARNPASNELLFPLQSLPKAWARNSDRGKQTVRSGRL